MEHLHTNLEIDNLDFDDMMHSRSSDAHNFDPEDDRDSVKHRVKNIGLKDINNQFFKEILNEKGSEEFRHDD